MVVAGEARAKHVVRKERGPDPEPVEVGRRSGDETWALLLRVSAQTFARQGYSGTSLQGIADELGMLKGSLYYYIHSKEDLLYEIIRDVLQRALLAAEPSIAGPGSGLDRLGALVETHVRHLVAHLPETTVYLNDVARLSAERRALLPEKEYVALFDQVIAQGREDGSIDTSLDATLTRRSVVGLVNSVSTWFGAAGDVSAEVVAAHVARVVQGGVRAAG